GLWRQIDAGDLGAAPGHRLAENAAAATHIEHALATQRGALVDVVEPHRIQNVQRTKFAARVPPALGNVIEAGDLGRVVIGSGGVHERLTRSPGTRSGPRFWRATTRRDSARRWHPDASARDRARACAPRPTRH